MNLRVVSAAVRTPDGLIYSVPAPGRHHDVVHRMVAKGGVQDETWETGFLLNTGQFARRVPAKRIATKAGQLLPRAMNLRELYSEDVW